VNGTKPKRIDTPAGTVRVNVPKTAGHEGVAFYPQSLERGRRSVRAVMLAVAEMYPSRACKHTLPGSDQGRFHPRSRGGDARVWY